MLESELMSACQLFLAEFCLVAWQIIPKRHALHVAISWNDLLKCEYFLKENVQVLGKPLQLMQEHTGL